MRWISLGGRDGDDVPHDVTDPMTRRLTVELPELVADGEAHVDVSSIVRLGSERVRRRRNLTAGGVAVGVVALVIGGTIVGRPAPTDVRTGRSPVVPVCASSAASSSADLLTTGQTAATWGWESSDQASSAPGSLAPSAINSRRQAARSAAESAAASSAESAAASAASAAERARAAAVSSAQASIAATVGSPPESGQPQVLHSVTWLNTAKGLQLTDALRAAMPTGVKILEGNDNWLRFDGSPSGLMNFPIAAAGSSAVLPTPDDVPIQMPTTSAYATVFTPGKGWGTLTVSVGQGEGVPACSRGGTERRLVATDGVAVDIGVQVNTLLADSSQSYAAVQVTAYRLDGTVVTATADTIGSGRGLQAPLPLTTDELVAIATASGLDVSASVSPAESSLAARVTTDQNGLVSTLPAPASVPARRLVSVAEGTPTSAESSPRG